MKKFTTLEEVKEKYPLDLIVFFKYKTAVRNCWIFL